MPSDTYVYREQNECSISLTFLYEDEAIDY